MEDDAPDFPPNRVNDLKVTISGNEISITFTATGEDLDDGTATRYELKYSSNGTITEDNWDDFDAIDDSSNDVVNGTLTPALAGEEMKLILKTSMFQYDTKYYMALKAFDKAKHSSELSINAVFNNIPFPENDDEGLSGGAIAGIIIGVLLAVGLLAFGVIFAKRKGLF